MTPDGCAIMRRMLRVGLTGNIGSGKSTIALMLAELGAYIIDADLIVHKLLMPGSDTYEKVVKMFGTGILQADGTVNRRRLGKIVFEAPDQRATLNGLVHPAVRSEIRARISDLDRKVPHGIVVVDAALMVETGYYKQFERLIVVLCQSEVQVKRVVDRDGVSIEEVRARLAAQMPAEEKAKVADYRIDNSGSREETRRQVAAVYEQLVRQEALI